MFPFLLLVALAAQAMGVLNANNRFGVPALLDTEGKPYLDAGLKYMKLSDSALLERIERDPKLLRLPLVRAANRLSIGQDEEAWKAMLA